MLKLLQQPVCQLGVPQTEAGIGVGGADHRGIPPHLPHKFLQAPVADGVNPRLVLPGHQGQEELFTLEQTLMQAQNPVGPLQNLVDQALRLHKLVPVHQPIDPEHRQRRRHAVVHPLPGGQRKPGLGHVPQPPAPGGLLGDFQLDPERPQGLGVLAQLPGVATVVIDRAQPQRNAVDQRKAKAGGRQHGAEQRDRRESPQQSVQQQEERPRQQVHQGSAQVIENIGEGPVVHLRRDHQALAAGPQQREPPAPELAVGPEPHPSADAEGAEAVARQQPRHKMPRLVEDDLNQHGHIEQEQQQRHKQHLLQHRSAAQLGLFEKLGNPDAAERADHHKAQ